MNKIKKILKGSILPVALIICSSTIFVACDKDKKLEIAEGNFGVIVDQTYTGDEIEIDFNTQLVEGEDYSIIYSNNTNAGTATATITGIGDYTGTVTLNFDIDKATPSYTKPNKFIVDSTLTLADVALPEGWTWENENTEIEIGTGNYKAIYTPNDTNNYKSVSGINIEIEGTAKALTATDFDVEDAVYTGNSISPTVVTQLVKDEDYTVGIVNNTNAGTATINFTGIGEYTGTVAIDFTIAKATPEYTLPTNIKATSEQTLADVDLPEGWEWNDENLSVGDIGSNTFSATFTPNDTTNYNSVIKDITVSVDYIKVTNQVELKDAVKIEGAVISLQNDLNLTEQIWIEKNVKILGNEKTISHSTGAFHVQERDVVFENIIFETDSVYNSNTSTSVMYLNSQIVGIINCTFNMQGSGTAITCWYGTTNISGTTFNDCAQGISAATQAESNKTRVNIKETNFNDCGYAVFTSSQWNNDVQINILESEFDNCGTFISQQNGKIILEDNIFKVGDKTNGSDGHFKSTKTELTISNSNEILIKYDNETVKEVKLSNKGNGTVEID